MSERRPAKVLVAEDEANLRFVTQNELQRLGYEVSAAANGEDALRLLEEGAVDVLLCDIQMPRIDGIELLRRVRERANPPEVIILTGHATIESAIEAMKLGAYDYLSKPYLLSELDALVRQAAEKRRLRVDNQRLRAQLARRSMPEIIGASPSIKETLRLVERVAPSDASVLISGESGTGKELIAQAIHRLSKRSDASFIDLNCAAFQDTLLESELFGHEAGAFSGAKSRKLGLFELADGGTIFLDEVTELPPQLQAKLLRATETRSFYRVGGVRKVQVDVRIVAATNRHFDSVLANNNFRADLLYRINGFQISIAPLRERSEDIEPLAHHLLKQLTGGGAMPELTGAALAALRAYSWPGNVRQLRNCLERAVLLASDGRITVEDLPPEVTAKQSPSPKVWAAPENGAEEKNRELSIGNGSATTAFVESPGGGGTAPNSATVPLRETERQQILAALEQTNWHRGKTAEMLGISPSTLYRRLRDYNLLQ
ncbi:MAG TPA: sigma-54 dependent transcriptional regulator [Pyrinomonadaceae bacterium]|nr:sigma-54 dependent transcriptional regulator [Pyrinomonadaceae bacterium]